MGPPMPHDRRQQFDLIREYLDGTLFDERVAEAERLLTDEFDAQAIPEESDNLNTFISRVQEAVAMPRFSSEQNDQTNKAIREAFFNQMQHLPGSADDTAAFWRSDPSVATDSEEDGQVRTPLAFLSPPQGADEIGRLNGYRLLRLLGEGGMGLVFEAEDLQLKRRVALKVMKPDIARKKMHRERFIREAQTAALVEHEFICPIYQVGQEKGVPFIAMPFLKGEPLDVRLRRQRPLPLAEAMRIGHEVAEGLAAAHHAGLVHRDIKPGNIWLVQRDESGKKKGAKDPSTETGSFQRVRILDFGLARVTDDELHLTQSGAIMGTPTYMAPEQARAKPVDHRADLFSLGVILYEMTTDRRPFTGSDTMSILTSLAIDEPSAPVLLNPAIPAELSNLIMQLLSKSPDKRPADGHEVSEALAAISIGMSRPIVEAMPPSAGASRATAVEATSIDPWEAIDESTTPGTSANAPASPAAPKRRNSRTVLAWIGLALALLAGGGALAAYKLYFETNEGKLVVEIEGDEADVRFKNGALNIYDSKGELKYTLKPSERSKSMPDGLYTVKVTGVDGLSLDTTEFTMTKNGATVRVRADSPAVAKKERGKTIAAPDPYRKAAEYVLSIGGTVKLHDHEGDFKTIAELPQGAFRLSSFNLGGNQTVSDAGLAVFHGCKDLTGIFLNGTKVSKAGLDYFKECKKLESLDLYYASAIDDAGLADLKDCCKDLKHLNLAGTKVTDAGLSHFKDCKKLRVVILFKTRITDDGLGFLQYCPDLEIAFLPENITDTGLAYLKDSKELRRISFNGSKVSDAGLANCQGWKLLEAFIAVGVPIGDAGLKNLKDCKSLLILELAQTKISDVGVALFEDCARLQEVNLSGTQVTDTGLQSFANAIELAQLRLDDTKVSDAGLAHLKNCKKVFIASLARTQVGDAGLATLKNWTKLTSVNLSGAKVTAKGIGELKEALPQCKIEWDGGAIEPAK